MRHNKILEVEGRKEMGFNLVVVVGRQRTIQK